MDAITFNSAKFKALVHYVIERCGAEQIGNTKLHKILYYSDMLHYVQTGHPITGEQYLKQRQGPTARHLTAALKELAREGALAISEVDHYGFRKKHYRQLKPADRRLLQDAAELAMVEKVIAGLIELSAREVSEISHAVPWQLAAMGEPIAYETAFSLTDVEITDEDVAWGLGEAARIAAQ